MFRRCAPVPIIFFIFLFSLLLALTFPSCPPFPALYIYYFIYYIYNRLRLDYISPLPVVLLGLAGMDSPQFFLLRRPKTLRFISLINSSPICFSFAPSPDAVWAFFGVWTFVLLSGLFGLRSLVHIIICFPPDPLGLSTLQSPRVLPPLRFWT